jgi:hypothetical protein
MPETATQDDRQGSAVRRLRVYFAVLRENKIEGYGLSGVQSLRRGKNGRNRSLRYQLDSTRLRRFVCGLAILPVIEAPRYLLADFESQRPPYSPNDNPRSIVPWAGSFRFAPPCDSCWSMNGRYESLSEFQNPDQRAGRRQRCRAGRHPLLSC